MAKFVKCNCQHCGGHIEFDRELLLPKNSAVPCPHCALQTLLYISSDTPPAISAPPPIILSEKEGNFTTASVQQEESEATGYQRTILRSLELFDEKYIRSLNERQAEEMVAASRVYKELLRSLREYGVLRERLPVEVERSLFQFTLTNYPTERDFLDYIHNNFPKVLLSGSYGKSKSRRNQLDREIRRTGQYAPPVHVEHLPARKPDDPDATPAQKRFLRDLGVRDEQVLSGLGKNAASDLIQNVLDERRKAGI